MFGDLHIHMILDGVYYRAAIDAQKEHPLDGLVRARLSDYQARGVCLLRDGGDAWGVSLRARELAGEYGIDYRSPAFPIYRRGHYGAFIGRGFDTEDEYRALLDEAGEKRADFIEKLFRRSRIPVHTVLDLACGTGTMTWLLTGRGYELIAVDGSEDMLAAAMGKSGTVEGVAPIFLHQSMPKLDLYGTVDAAICCLDSLNYLTRPADVQRTFQRLHLFIAPGGLLVFDINTVEKLAALDGQVFLDETEDTYCVWRTEYRRGLCTYYVDLFRQQGDGAWDRELEIHRQRAYTVEELTGWLKAAGFTDIRTCGDMVRRSPREGEQRIYFTAIRK